MIRGGLLALAFLGLLAAGAVLWLRLAFPPVPYAPPPPPPAIELPRGEIPAGPVGMQLWIRYRGEVEHMAGSAFLLVLPDGRVVGATAAHNLQLADAERPLETAELRIANGNTAERMQLSGLHGEPGQPRRFGLNLSKDHALLRPGSGAAQNLILEPDPRGGAQPGERILLIGGIDGERHAGSVFQADARGIWCLMDGEFEPGLLSGSPVVSQHTGTVVGMAVAAGWREGRLVIGLHPIGALVEAGLRDDSPLELPG